MKLNVAVIFGGRSVEHEISVISAAQCIQAIDKEKYRVIPIYISKEGVWYNGKKLLNIDNFKDIDILLSQCQKVYIEQNIGEHKLYRKNVSIFTQKILTNIDIVFPVLHGTYGEDGALQGLLELMKIPYVGCDVLSSAVTMDKVMTKILLQSLSIPVLNYVWFYSQNWIEAKEKVLEKIFAKLSYPLIVKPGNLGSSIGVNSASNQFELEDAIDLAVSMSQRILIEPKIENLKEVNCAVLGDREAVDISVCEEPLRSDMILSYRDKYLSGGKQKTLGTKSQGMNSAQRKIPAEISEETAKKIRDFAKKAFINLNCSGVVRIDFLIEQKTNKIYLCELNTIPGSLSFYLWQPCGINFTELTDRLLALALKRHREKDNLILSYDTNILKNLHAGAKI